MIAGYISGSKVDLARVFRENGRPVLTDHTTVRNNDYSDFESILRYYTKRHPGQSSKACFGVAGPVIGQEVTTTNLPWRIVASSVEKEFSLNKVHLVNDIVATAYGLAFLDDDRFYTINEGESHSNGEGNLGLIAAGTGLGETLIYRDGSRYLPFASEGGHADFAPGNQLETELWEYLYAENQQVEVEDIVSLSGLERTYNFLVDVHGAPRGDWLDNAKDKPAAIIEQALSGKDEAAIRTLDIFIDCYASEAANLALKGMTIGGLYIGGQIAPRIITALDNGRFMERFIKRGKMERLLSRIPVGVIIEEKTALIGAAGLALDL
jgi:glucokinase